MAEKIEEAAQKLEALIKILNEENELNNENLFRMINAREFKNIELINKDSDLSMGIYLLMGNGDVTAKWVGEYATDITNYNADFRRK